MKKSILREYAKLIVRCGINVRKGQDVMIHAGLDQPEFVKLVVEEAYKAKARKVTVEWSYDALAKIHVRYQSVKTLSEVPQWQKERQEYYCETLPARIHIVSEDPDGMKGMDFAKMAKARKISYPILKPYIDRRDGYQQWCIAAVPGVAWAKKVFPGLPKGRAVEKLWEAILSASRVTDDPVKAWDDHNADLKKRCDYLNSLSIRSLHYTADNGTDLTVGMIPEAMFCGGGEVSRQGIFFNPNIPTEEVFISPKKGIAEGVVVASKPLSYRGELIENFSVRFEGGKAVEVHAEKNEALLREMVSMDEGAAYLGEVALVPYNSPIRNSEILFYNTLFDENAACHLALGHGFTNTLKDYDKYTIEECYEKGINDSMIHVDFMIGTEDLSVVAVTREGKRIQVFENGNWAF